MPGSGVIQGTIVQASHFRFAMRKHIKSAGFTPPADRALGSEHRTAVVAELVASHRPRSVCVLVAATVVSIGVARADVASNVIDNEGGLFAIALLLGLLFIGMGGLTTLSLPHHQAQKDPQLNRVFRNSGRWRTVEAASKEAGMRLILALGVVLATSGTVQAADPTFPSSAGNLTVHTVAQRPVAPLVARFPCPTAACW